jgi:hypothetical protein
MAGSRRARVVVADQMAMLADICKAGTQIVGCTTSRPHLDASTRDAFAGVTLHHGRMPSGSGTPNDCDQNNPNLVMAGLVPAIHVFLLLSFGASLWSFFSRHSDDYFRPRKTRRRWPGQARP